MKWNKLPYLTLTVCLILLQSCANNSSSQNTLPQWYINPTQNNSQFIFGVGEGYTIQEAKNSALMEASSRLSTTISGETNLIRQETDIDSSDQFYQNIKGKANDLQFKNYTISNSISSNNKLYVEVKIDKSSFINDYKKEIDDLFQSITTLDKNSANQNILIRLMNLQKITQLSQKINFYYKILESLGYNSLKSQQIDKITTLNEEAKTITQKIEFYIDKNTPDEIANIIGNNLNKEGIKILKIKPTQFTNNQIILKTKTNEDINQIYGNYIVKYNISFESWSQNKILASNTHEVVGSSPASKEIARKMAFKKFENSISKQNILNVFGIKN